MSSNVSELQRCKEIIERKLDWGPSETWQSTDFENLSELILDATGVSLSVSTLRRIWGRVTYDHLPSVTTLNTLSKFAGFEDWRSFTRKPAPVEDLPATPEAAPVLKSRFWKKLVWIGGVLLLALAGIFAFDKKTVENDVTAYSFSSKPVTRGLPNSVIFNYDATSSATDSVFIQQSWDGRTRTRVDKNLHKHTSIYYEPGFYIAKLIVGGQIVKEHKLLIPSDGWLGIVDSKPVPVYLKREEFLYDEMLTLPRSAIEGKNVTFQPKPPMVKFSNVGNFKPVSLRDFSFSVKVKNNYHEGAAACQFSYIMLVTDDFPIGIPLSAKGCISELNLFSIDTVVNGKKADLSALGVDFSDWVKVTCKSEGGKIRYLINEKLIFEYPVPAREIHVVGMSYMFQGTGSVKNIVLSARDSVVFHDFDDGGIDH